MTRSIVLTNHKGGVGKSTSATNIALELVHVLRHVKANNCVLDATRMEYLLYWEKVILISYCLFIVI